MLPSITMHVLQPGPSTSMTLNLSMPNKRRRLGQSLPNLCVRASLPTRKVPERINKFSSPVCKRPFPRESARDVHQRLLHPWTILPDGSLQKEPGEMPFKCDKCKKRFPNRTMCFLHRRLHSGRMSQRCPSCSRKVYIQHTNLKHMRVPTTQEFVPPFVCTCGKVFETKENVDLHVERRAQVPRPLKCICGCNLKQQVLIKPSEDLHDASMQHLNSSGKRWAGIVF